MQKKIHFLVSPWNHEYGESFAEQVKPKGQKFSLFLKGDGNPDDYYVYMKDINKP